VFIELIHHVVTAINYRISLMLVDIRHAVASESTHVMLVDDASVTNVIVTVAVIVGIVSVDRLQKAFKIAHEIERQAMLFLACAKLDYEVLRIAVGIWILHHLRCMLHTLRFVSTKTIGRREWVQAATAHASATFVSSPAGDQARHVFDPHVVASVGRAVVQQQ